MTAPPPITEKAFQAQIVQLALLTGWKVYHTHDSRRSEPGFPDLVLVRPRQVIFLEVKTAKGRISKAQEEWMQLLRTTGNIAAIVRPADWDFIKDTLTRPVSDEPAAPAKAEG